ncbi:MAG: TlpA family protein disulfide reductase [Gammaproteobacteria bacterium]|nr:TlpA family protein disulfide reductase [Gammaproteobacteria bacterium]
MKRGVLFFLAALIAAGGGYAVHRTNAISTAPIGAGASDPLTASFNDLEGKPRTLAQWRGQVLVVNFWATWCPPCLKEIPAFMELQRRLGKSGVQFLGVALDGRSEVAAFVRQHELNYPTLAGEEDVARYMQAQGNKIGALPFTLVFDRAGALRHTHQGEWPSAALEKVLTAALTK